MGPGKENGGQGGCKGMGQPGTASAPLAKRAVPHRSLTHK